MSGTAIWHSVIHIELIVKIISNRHKRHTNRPYRQKYIHTYANNEHVRHIPIFPNIYIHVFIIALCQLCHIRSLFCIKNQPTSTENQNTPVIYPKLIARRHMKETLCILLPIETIHFGNMIWSIVHSPRTGRHHKYLSSNECRTNIV